MRWRSQLSEFVSDEDDPWECRSDHFPFVIRYFSFSISDALRHAPRFRGDTSAIRTRFASLFAKLLGFAQKDPFGLLYAPPRKREGLGVGSRASSLSP